MECSTVSAMIGFLVAIMGNPSAHEAQHAAGDHQLADRKPRPPIRIGRVATCCALSCSTWLPGTSDRRRRAVAQDPLVMSSRVPFAHRRWQGANGVVSPWVCALQQDLPNALKVWTAGMVSHNKRSSANRRSTFSAMCSRDPMGVSRTVMPLGCQTSGPGSSTFCGAVPDRFHTLVLPS